MRSAADPIRVLHVEDRSEMGDLTATWLEREDERIEVETVGDASAGLDALAEDAFDCVVSDYEMPGRDGIEFLELVREDDPDLPFILFTGKGSEEVASDAISAGVSDYLQKETGTDQYAVLANRIANLVEQHRVERQLRRSQRELTETTQTLEAVIQASPVPIVTVDLDGVVEIWNQAAEEVFGWTESEVAGDPLPLLSDDSSTLKDVCEDVVDGDAVTDVRIQRETKRGETKDLVLSAAPIRDADGAVSGAIAVLTEVSERERTLEQLHEVTRNLLRAESRDEVARLTVEAVRDTLGYPNNLVRFVDDAGEGLRPVAATSGAESLVGDRPIYPVGEGTAGRAFESGETLLYEDVRELDDGYDRKNARAGMYVPIGEYGTLSIGDTEPGAFDESDVQLAEIFAANAEAALQRVERVFESH